MALTGSITLTSGVVRRAPALSTRALLVSLVFVLVFALNVFGYTDPDFWWHVKTGEYMVQTGAIPQVDVFSYTFLGEPRVPQEWASEVLMFLPFRALGYWADVLVFASVVTLTFFLLFRLCIRLGVDGRVSALLVSWGAMLARPMFTVRPQIFTWLLFVIFLASLYLYERRLIRRLWHLPPLMVLWVNLHGGFAIGLGLIGLTILVECVDRLVMKRPSQVKQLLIILAFSVLATLVSPSGWSGLTHPLSYIGFANPSARFISEWKSPDFHEYYWLLLLASLILFMAMGVANRRTGAWPVMLVAVLATMALQSTRNIPLYGLGMVPVMGESLEARFNFRRLAKRQPPTRVLGYVNWLLLVGLIVGAFTLAAVSPGSQLRETPLRFRGIPYPSGGAEFIRANYPEARMFNDYDWGGYLIYTLYPTQRVFVDGRADLYSPQFLEDYADVVGIRPGWEEILGRYGVDLALIQKDSPLSIMLTATPTWQKVFTGDIEDVFVRKRTTD